MPTWIGIVLVGVMGVSLGLLGGGGSILAVPILVYILGLAPHAAIAVSLLLVGSTALLASLLHLRAARVDVRAAFLFALFAAPVSLVGARVSQLFRGTALLFLFALLMIGLSVPMWRGRREAEAGGQPGRRGTLIACAMVVGFLTGFLGIGGGFLIVPALVLFAGLPMKRAVGTSLLVIALTSGVALIGHRAHLQPVGELLWPVWLAALAGTSAGVWISRWIGGAHLRKGFALFILLLGIWMAAQNAAGLLR